MDLPIYNGNIFYPPRPETSLSPEKLADYEGKWLAQRKFNGTRTMIEFAPSGIKLWTRHKEEHKAYKPSPAMAECLAMWHDVMGKDARHIIDGELLHNKTRNIKDVFVAFDVLVFDDQYLVGTKYLERYDHLSTELMGGEFEWEEVSGNHLALQFVPGLWLAENFYANFHAEYERHINLDEIEGLVLKKASAELDYGFKMNNNGSWLLRCRKPSKNYKY